VRFEPQQESYDTDNVHKLPQDHELAPFKFNNHNNNTNSKPNRDHMCESADK